VLVRKADTPPLSVATTGLTFLVRGDGGRKCRVLCVTVVVEGVLERLGACANSGVLGALDSLSPALDLIDSAEGAREPTKSVFSKVC
jgi:hypothetical protein